MPEIEFDCPIRIAAAADTGKVILQFGPIDAEHVRGLFLYIKQNPEFEGEMLDEVAQTLARADLEDLDNA